MKSSRIYRDTMNQTPYHTKTADDYMQEMKPDIVSSLSSEQLDEIKVLINRAIPKPSPKIVDLRFNIDLLISRFYVVLFVGKENRRVRRRYQVRGITKVGNFIIAIFLLISLNLLVSLFIVMSLYLLKVTAGVDFFHQGHLIDHIKNALD